jgi:two-component system, cell cycle sensor histidine kinase and response regulator CckA
MTPRIVSFDRWRAANAPQPRATRVLFVDDDDLFRTFVDRVLQDAGFETAVARDGEEALAIAGNAPAFDLLLTDEMMPCIPGHQLARYMRSRQPSIKVLYVTGYSDRLFGEKQSLWADEAFLEKPCGPAAIVQAVSLLISGSTAVPQARR